MVAFAIAFNGRSQSCKASTNADRTLIRIPVWLEWKGAKYTGLPGRQDKSAYMMTLIPDGGKRANTLSGIAVGGSDNRTTDKNTVFR
jgi:hypothetical protein